MSSLDELLRRNHVFAQTGAKDQGPAIPFIPNRQVYILTCITRGGYDEAELAALAVLDPAVTVPADVDRVLAAPQLPERIKVTGLAYDVKTGLVTTVVPSRSR